MVRNYKKKGRIEISESVYVAAIHDVLFQKKSYRETAAKFNINITTLFKRVKRARGNLGEAQKDDDSGHSEDEINLVSLAVQGKPKYSVRQIFNTEQEDSLKDYLIKCAKQCYGLTVDHARDLAYNYASFIKIPIPQSWNTNRKAGIDWMQSFMKRHPALSLRKPESTSLSRAISFNKAHVQTFFENLTTVMEKYKFKPQRIYNLDETGITTVLPNPKVIAESKTKQVGQIVSQERGELVTFVGFINAIGSALPPVYIFPRVKYKDVFLSGAPIGSMGMATKSGWMTATSFVEALIHLKNHAMCSKEDQILLLLDNHTSHVSIEAINYARDNGIIILSFPPHCSHRLQPLDISVYGPFKSALKVSFQDRLTNKPGSPITIYDIAKLSQVPFYKAFSAQNINSGFQNSGIWPLNTQIFNDDDFMASMPSEQPYLSDVGVVEEVALPIPESNKPNPNVSRDPLLPESESDSQNLNISLENIRPFPRFVRKNANKRRLAKSTIYTDTPEKNKLLEKFNAKQPKKKQSSKPLPKKNLEPQDSSDSEISVNLNDSSGDSNFCGDISSDDLINLPKTLLDSDELKENEFVLVNADHKGRPIYYVGKIIQVHSRLEFDITFIRKSASKTTSFIYPLMEDISVVSRQDVKYILPSPAMQPGTSRAASRYAFDTDLSKFVIR